MALAALVLLAVLAVVVVVLAVRQVRLGVQHQRTRLLVDALDARVGGVQRRLEEVPGIGTGRHEVALVLNPIKTHADRVRRELERLAEAEGLGEVLVLETQEDDPGTAMARQALDAGARLVIAAGGDGTVRTVAEQLAGRVGAVDQDLLAAYLRVLAAAGLITGEGTWRLTRFGRAVLGDERTEI